MIRLIDLAGKVWRQEILETSVPVSIDDLPNGLYLLETINSEGSSYQQLIIKQ